MATLGKNQHGPGREKRGLSPSSFPRQTDTPHTKRSPSAPSPCHPPGQKSTLSTTPQDQKRIPNYLKPTASSSPNPSVQGRTQSPSTNTAQKPSLNRRRSFDKPPSPNSRLQKSHTLVNNSTEKIILRSSSSIVPRTNSSFAKPHQERVFKAHRDAGRSHPVLSGNKKAVVKKQGIDASTSATAASTKAPNSSSSDITSDATHVLECHQEDPESSVTNVEDDIIIKVEESNNELPPDVSVQEEDRNEDLIKPETGRRSQVREAEPEKYQNEDLNLIEPSKVLEEQDEVLDVHMEEAVDEEQLVEETKIDGSDESHQEESVAEKPIVDGEEEEGEESATESSTEKVDDKKEEVDEGSQTESKEREEVEDLGTEPIPEVENATGKQQRQGKKESQAYNEVIEETASKLLEKRKNKVKALVGAFETVISLQEPEG